MTRWALLTPLLLLLGLFIHSAVSQAAEDPAAAAPPPPGQASDGTQAEDENEEWGMNSLRGSFEAVSGYFDSMLEFMGGRDGVCQYRCRYGKAPLPRPEYQMQNLMDVAPTSLDFPCSRRACLKHLADTLFNTVWTLGCRPRRQPEGSVLSRRKMN
ncbi:group XIIB secretory phospholipase A2-like protein [Lates japonicus]|uniref:Group XIIB secretory phospholipase A2-like protein n=1 Tax=Lates japonicus TaxID=270547 RepID=A0AAD3RAP7_LATJO|nr:group XIIB secretory phospholipase A2-like protein [Lates japonicus]